MAAWRSTRKWIWRFHQALVLIGDAFQSACHPARLGHIQGDTEAGADSFRVVSHRSNRVLPGLERVGIPGKAERVAARGRLQGPVNIEFHLADGSSVSGSARDFDNAGNR